MCEEMVFVVFPVKSCETQQLMSLQDLALGRGLCQAGNMDQIIDSRHIGDLGMRFDRILVRGTRFKDQSKRLCWVQQHDPATLSAVVAEELNGNWVVHIIREVEKNVVIF